MEEHASPIRFVQGTSFFMCRFCRNHVLPLRNSLFEIAFYLPQPQGSVLYEAAIGLNAVNVRVDNAEPRWLLFVFRVLDVYCRGCGRNLGHEIVMNEERNQFVPARKFMFYLDRMLYCSGNQVSYADTMQPVEDN